ncbi:Potassium voltage-gated channel subfamily S member 3 [Aix galericulata]|nr:Potassium voltage-gated channel subfamily S member 3 [Aix galericulata]
MPGRPRIEKIGKEIEYWGINELFIDSCCSNRYQERKEEGPEKDWDQKSNDRSIDSSNEESSIFDKELEKFDNLCFGEIRKKIWVRMENPAYCLSAKLIAVSSLSVVLASIVAMCIHSMPEFQRLDANDREIEDPVLEAVEIACIIWFTAELVIRLITAPSQKKFWKKPLNIIDFVSIIPFYATLAVDTKEEESEDIENMGKVVQILRLMRIFRILKLARHSKDSSFHQEIQISRGKQERPAQSQWLKDHQDILYTHIYYRRARTWRTCRQKSRTELSEARSSCRTTSSPPPSAASRSPSSARISLAARSARARSRQPMMTRAFIRSSSAATARPSPLLAPVMITVLPRMEAPEPAPGRAAGRSQRQAASSRPPPSTAAAATAAAMGAGPALGSAGAPLGIVGVVVLQGLGEP